MNKRFFIPASILLLSVLALPAFSQKFPGFSKSKTGLFYKTYKTGADTITPRTGNYVEFDMVYSGKSHGKDSVFFDSRKQDKPGPVKFFLPPPVFRGDLNEGIAMLAKGDSGVFIVNADSLIFKTFRMKRRPEGIDSNSYFTFRLHLISFITQESMIFKEETDIKKYVQDSNITVRPNGMGLYIIESHPGAGAKIDSGCQVTMNYKVTLLDGKVLFSTYERPEPVTFEFGKKIDTPGFEFAVTTLKKGSKAKFIVPSNLAFGRKGSGSLVAPYQTIVYDVEILDVKTKAEFEAAQTEKQKSDQMKSDSLKNAEPILLEKYIKDNNIKAKPLPSGLYYIPVVTGTGPRAEAGKTVKVHYTGKLLNGKVFDSSKERNTPIEFMLGRSQVIKGWDEGIALMNQGGKATLIIPSAIAYGERDMSVIPPYSTLVFEVELVEVK
ncbi:MAG: FKBP-type peptidyl-prolyl cis-trans isomerase [Bacteroidetes bacterium]|nr:FKBP-type peptidyl-prolyl cis-trans isomerase [Bacteroidota bacterium]